MQRTPWPVNEEFTKRSGDSSPSHVHLGAVTKRRNRVRSSWAARLPVSPQGDQLKVPLGHAAHARVENGVRQLRVLVLQRVQEDFQVQLVHVLKEALDPLLQTRRRQAQPLLQDDRWT
mmetsp:Transcript_13273/g.48323  ORF Transcript_13273/g.48323 Transcript_13273/m.48323 type:complete len:118 (-) Transcript_13273:77-430(-)